MKTVYTYEDNVLNLEVFILLILVFVVLIIGLIFFLPLLKQCLHMAKTMICNDFQSSYSEIKKAKLV